MNASSRSAALRGFVAGAAAAACAIPAWSATPTGNPYYDQMLVGPFGSLTQVTSGPYAVATDGGSLQFQSSASNSIFLRGSSVTLSAMGSNSFLDGTLHARADADSCADQCWGGAYGSGTTTAYWDKFSLDTGSAVAGPVKMALRVDGFAEYGGYGKIRYYVGNSALNPGYTQPYVGWHYLNPVGGGEIDVRFDLGEVEIHPGLDGFLFVELQVFAGSGPNGHSIADFGNTVHFEWEVPEGMKLNSASGVFMSAVTPVPEPATPVLSLLGAAVLAGARLRRRKGASD